VKVTYLNKRKKKKQFRGVILGQKSILNHPSSMEEEVEKTRFKEKGGD
jgi:hypothetical protein